MWASVVVECGLSNCTSWALEHRLNSCAPWHMGSSWIELVFTYLQVDSLPLSHQGSPQGVELLDQRATGFS